MHRPFFELLQVFLSNYYSAFEFLSTVAPANIEVVATVWWWILQANNILHHTLLQQFATSFQQAVIQLVVLQSLQALQQTILYQPRHGLVHAAPIFHWLSATDRLIESCFESLCAPTCPRGKATQLISFFFATKTNTQFAPRLKPLPNPCLMIDSMMMNEESKE